MTAQNNRCNDYLHHFYRHYICCHWHEELEIPVVLKGHVRYRLKNKTFELHSGQGLVINSRVPHSAVSISEEEPVLLTTILHPSLLYGTPASIIYQKLLFPYMNADGLSGILLSPDQADTLKQVDLIFRTASFGHELQIKSLLCSLFSELLSPYEEALAKTGPAKGESLSRLELLLDELHRSYTEPLSLSALAAKISVSREGCCRFFKKMTGKLTICESPYTKSGDSEN